MIEKDLKKLHWNPHTCRCKLTYRKEVTRRLEPRVVPYGSGDCARLVEQYGDLVGKLRLLVAEDDRLMVHVPRYETTLESLDGEPWTREHELSEVFFSPGTRIRATIRHACFDHESLTDVSMKMQYATCPRVCHCTWMEVHHESTEEESGWKRFGERVVRVCIDDEHAETPYRELPDKIRALANALPAPRQHRVSYDQLDDGRVVHRLTTADGQVFEVVMAPLESVRA